MPIQPNLDGTLPELSLKQIFEVEPKAKALYCECVTVGLKYPLRFNEDQFEKRGFRQKLEKIAGFDAEKPLLRTGEAYEKLYKACMDALDCWSFWKKVRNKKWGFSAFITKYYCKPYFNL